MAATASTECFSKQELAQFASGCIEVDRLDRMTAHIDTCAVCQATIAELDEPPDSFVANLQELPGHEEGDEESACRAVVDRLVQVHADAAIGPDELPQIPESIGGYRVLELAGMGGMGMVYKAQHPKLKRLVAIKLLPMQRSSGPAAIARFQREMELIGSLDHPNIVRASDAGEEDGMHYLVMDYVDGLDLSRLVRRTGPLSVADACEIVRQAAQGLAHVHDASLVHRDIKPSNMMVTRDGRVKILDLGLAMLSQQYLEGENNLTTIGQLMGTLDYMAPEQAADSHQVDARADVYSLGATLFQLLTGQAPYGDGRHNSLLKKVLALASAQVPSARALRSDLPESLDQIIMKCLAKEPNDRYADVREVTDALSIFAAGADLQQLIRRAAEKPEPDRFRRSVWSMAAVFGQRKEQAAAAAKPSAGGGKRLGGLMRLLAAGALFGVVATAVIVFRVITDHGELIVRSEDPDARIVVRHLDGQPVKEMTLQQGKGTVTIRSGEYAVELASDADQWTLSPGHVTIVRDGRAVVSVERKALAAGPGSMMPGGMGSPMPGGGGMMPGPTAAGSGSLEAYRSQLVYDGKTYHEWIAIMATERSPERLTDAAMAISVLAPEAGSEEAALTLLAAKSLLKVMRAFGAATLDSTPAGKLRDSILATLLDLEPHSVAQAVCWEMQQGNNRSREFLSLLVQMLYIPSVQQGNYYQKTHPDLRRAMRELAPEMMAVLLAMSHSDDLSAARWAREMMASLVTSLELSGGALPEVQAYWQKLLGSSDPEEKYLAAIALSQLAPASEGLGNALIDLLDDEGRRNMAIEAIGRLGPHAPSVAPQLLEILTKEMDKLTAERNPFGASMGGHSPAGGMIGGFDHLGVWATGMQIMNTLKQSGQAEAMIPILRKYTEQLPSGPAHALLKQLEQSTGEQKNSDGESETPDSNPGPGASSP